MIPISRERKLNLNVFYVKTFFRISQIQTKPFLPIATPISSLEIKLKTPAFFSFFFGGGGCFRQSATLKFVHRFFFLLKVVSNPKSTCTCSNVLSMIYLGYRTLVLHLHKKSPSKVFYISDTAQTNLKVKVTKTCHNGKLTPSIISNGIVVIPSTESQKCMKD